MCAACPRWVYFDEPAECVTCHEPALSLDPDGRVRHPTCDKPAAFAEALRRAHEGEETR